MSYFKDSRALTPPQLLPTSTAGDSDVKRVEGTVAALTAAEQLVVLIGNEMVGRFESESAGGGSLRKYPRHNDRRRIVCRAAWMAG